MHSTRPAYSLVFAFVFMTVLMIVAGSAIQNTNNKLALYNDLGGSAQAALAAQSAAEQAVVAIQDTDGDGENDYSPGYEANSDDAFCSDPDGDGTCNSWGAFTTLAEGRDYGGYFYTPLFGTGSAGGEDCSALDYIDLDTGEAISGLSIDVNEPCHWNKLLYGDSVTIPLFDTVDSDDIGSLGEIRTPADLAGFSGWNLKIRTPCSDGTMDSGCERYELNEDGEISGEGDTVVFWQLIGKDDAGNEVSLVPEDATGTDRATHIDSRVGAGDRNTEVYESLINDALSTDSVVLKADSSGHYENLLNFCLGDLDGDGTSETTLTSLYLQLDIVTPLKDTTDLSIPYLEWQLEMSSSEPFADNKTTLIGQGYSKGSKNTYYSSSVISRSTTGESASIYTLSN